MTSLYLLLADMTLDRWPRLYTWALRRASARTDHGEGAERGEGVPF